MRRRGFTLIEVLMTVALTAMVFAMIGGILLSVINASENIEKQLASEKAGYGILSTIRRDLTGLYAYDLGGLAFKGVDNTEGGKDADTLHFVTTADSATSADGTKPKLVEVGYRLRMDNEILGLYRRAGAFEGDPISSGESYTEIFAGLHSFNVQYMDPDNKEWKDEWTDAEKLPLAVKVTIELALTEGERIAAQQGGREVPPPKFEMVVGIPVFLKGPEDKPAPAGGTPPPPGG